MRISDWSSDVCSSDLNAAEQRRACPAVGFRAARYRHQTGQRQQDQQQIEGAVRPDARYSFPARQFGRERSEEHTSELQSLMRISYAVFCLKKKQKSENKHVGKINI